MSKKKRLVVGIMGLVLLVSLGAGIFIYLRTRLNHTKKNDTALEITPDEAVQNYIRTSKDPKIQASLELGLASTQMTLKNYDKVIEYSNTVMNKKGVPADLIQIARRTLMIAYNQKGDNTNAKKYALEYKNNIPSTDESLKATELAFIESQIKAIDANEKLQTTGGSEEGD